MKYLLDTCIISELTKPDPNPIVVKWLNGAHSESLFLSVLTIGEIRKGLSKMKSSKKKTKVSLWLNMLLSEYDERIIPLNLAVAENWGLIQGKAESSGTPMSSIDSLLAATAYTYNLALVTRNEKDFNQVQIINPWKL